MEEAEQGTYQETDRTRKAHLSGSRKEGRTHSTKPGKDASQPPKKAKQAKNSTAFSAAQVQALLLSQHSSQQPLQHFPGALPHLTPSPQLWNAQAPSQQIQFLPPRAQSTVPQQMLLVKEQHTPPGLYAHPYDQLQLGPFVAQAYQQAQCPVMQQHPSRAPSMSAEAFYFLPS